MRAAAAALSVHEDTIHRLLERGELRAVRIGRAVRIEQDELVRYIHRQRGEPVPPPRNPMSPPQRACLHARADEVDRRRTAPRGTSKREALAAAAAEFGREFDSSSQLTIDEASWVIDWLTDKLVQLDEEAER